MPLASFKRIQEVSSEDKKHVAQNLLKGDAGMKWKTRQVGESQAYVVLELQQPEKILGIDIGNEHSAFIGVSVGKSNFTASEFRDLLITSSFMTPTESKNSSNPNRVICFNTDVLVPDTVAENWSLVKITCTQPFNKHVQYGLSFVKLRVAANLAAGSQEKPKTSLAKAVGNSPPKLHLKLREETPDSESESPGTSDLFKRWKTNNCSTNDSPSSSKPKQLTPILSIKETNKNLLKKRDSLNASSAEVLPIIPKNPIKVETTEHIKNKENNSVEMVVKTPKKVINPLNTSDCSSSAKKSPKNHNLKAKSPRQQPTNRKYRPFGSLLDGVVLVISGIQNPERADLRNKALALGAKYKANWDDSCTHLICAFKNTPKYNEVLGKGKIVKRTWIEESFNQRKYLPWRRYALVSTESTKPESDEEVWEEATPPEESSSSNNDMSDDEETPDNKSKSITTENSSPNVRKRSVYEATTDEEDYLPKKCPRKS